MSIDYSNFDEAVTDLAARTDQLAAGKTNSAPASLAVAGNDVCKIASYLRFYWNVFAEVEGRWNEAGAYLAVRFYPITGGVIERDKVIFEVVQGAETGLSGAFIGGAQMFAARAARLALPELPKP